MSKTALILNSNGMGDAPIELAKILITNYVKVLNSESHTPDYICLYASGVQLACEGSPLIDDLLKLENKGTKIIICKTCLGFYELLDKVKVGLVGTMMDIVEIQFKAGKVITL